MGERFRAEDALAGPGAGGRQFQGDDRVDGRLPDDAACEPYSPGSRPGNAPSTGSGIPPPTHSHGDTRTLDRTALLQAVTEALSRYGVTVH